MQMLTRNLESIYERLDAPQITAAAQQEMRSMSVAPELATRLVVNAFIGKTLCNPFHVGTRAALQDGKQFTVHVPRDDAACQVRRPAGRRFVGVFDQDVRVPFL